MAIVASFHTSYHLSNFEGILRPVLDEAEDRMTIGLREEVARAAAQDQEEFFVRRWQLPFAAGCAGVEFTIGELCDSYKNEMTSQVILPSSVKNVLLGRDGLIRKAGGGRCHHLLQDIQVGFVKDITVSAEPVGPIIMSGRNRLIGIQAFIKTALPGMLIDEVKVRCLAYTFTNRQDLEDAIVAANSGRDFPRSENREKKAARTGLDLSSKEAIEASLLHLNSQPPLGVVLGTWLKYTSAENQLNSVTPAQISDAGASLANRLAKDVRPEGKTLGRWLKDDPQRAITLCRSLEARLEGAITMAVSDRSAGAISRKLAHQLYWPAMDALQGR